MKRRLNHLALLSIICILCGLISAFTFIGTPAPVTRTGLSNIAVKQIDSCLLVYGINTANNSLVVDMYDPQLRLVHQFSEKIAGFIPYTVTLQYQSELRLEFVITDHYNSKKQYIFLDTELKAYYRSQVSPPVTLLIPASIKVIDNFRIDDFAWEIRTETQDAGAGRTLTLTTLYQYGIKLLPTFPFYEVNRAIVLDSSAVEYAKVFLVRDNKIYVYVNQSTENGKQFVYCLSGLDGKLIYKTQLRVQYDDDRNPEGAKPYAKSCIFSKAIWNQKLNKLMISGTWMTDAADQSGLFLLMMNEDGTINSSIGDKGSILNRPVEYESATGIVGHGVTSQTYQCVKKMDYQLNGNFVVFTELYGRDANRMDEDYHYFCVEAQYFDVTNGSIKPRKYEKFTALINWNANHHLDSIAGFVPKQTKLSDRHYANDMNRICDGTLGGPYFQSAFLTGKTSTVKLLSRNDVAVSPTQNTVAYFSKSVSGAGNLNCIAFLSPNPIHEQNFSERNDFYAIDAQRLYRVTLNGNGYTVKVIGW